MTIRTKAIIVGLATLAGGCTITPRHEEVRVYQSERRVIHETDAYEGYYYVGIVYLNGIPWYVDEDLRARPVPPHLHTYFRDSSWARSMPPRFSRDSGMRDGYSLARVIYINEVPYYVDEDRRARPIPSKLRSRFPYESVAYRDSGRRPVERPEPPYYRNQTRPAPPAYGRERQEPPTYGGGNALGRAAERAREEARPAPPAYGRDRQEPRGYEADNAPDRMMRTERMREETRPIPPAVVRERQPSALGGGDALGRAAERVREEPRPVPPVVEREPQEPPTYGNGNAPGRPAERAREETRPVPPVVEREPQEPPTYGGGTALGRAAERAREEARPVPPVVERERQEPPAYEADNAPRRGGPPERMREDAGRQVPPFARNDRMPPRQDEDLPAVRGNGRDERRGPPASREVSPDIAQGDRGQVQASDDRQRGMDAATGRERGNDPAPERKNGKGRGHNKDQETDSSDGGDRDAGRRNGRE